MGYAVNLDHAWQAVWHVQNKITVGASNRREAFFSLGMSVLCVAAQRSVDVAVPRDEVLPSWILQEAAKAEHVGCANCGEQASLAFVYLFQKLKARPLDYMSRTNADHAFVVIGRATDSDVADFTTWGESCVVCDPWDNKAFQASQIPKAAYKGVPFGVESAFRIS